MYQIAPSILSANFARLGEEVDNVLASGADIVHFDVMDNHYVPNLTIGPLVCEALRKHGVTAPIDVHLMVKPVDRIIPDFVKAGASYITFHPEASEHIDRTIGLIKESGCKAGLVFNPATPLDVLEYTLPKLDMVLLMSVNPGFGGQKFIPYVLDKARKVRAMIDAGGHDCRLEIDGGVGPANIREIAAAGVDTFVAGSAIFNARKETDVTSTTPCLPRCAPSSPKSRPRNMSQHIKRYTTPVSVKAVVIDLDGTLLHTAPELAEAANRMLQDMDYAPVSQELLASYIGNGISWLVKRALTGDMHATPDAALYDHALPIFEKHYTELLLQSRVFEGVIEGLDAMKAAGFRLGCITNKVERYTVPLLAGTGLAKYFDIVLSGDTLPEKKPHPMPLLHAAKFFGVPIDKLLLIGDSLNDTLAARAAECPVFCVPYGYNHGEPVETLDQDAVIPNLTAALPLMKLA